MTSFLIIALRTGKIMAIMYTASIKRPKKSSARYARAKEIEVTGERNPNLVTM